MKPGAGVLGAVLGLAILAGCGERDPPGLVRRTEVLGRPAPAISVLDQDLDVVLAPGDEHAVAFSAMEGWVYTLRLAWSVEPMEPTEPGSSEDPGASLPKAPVPALWGGPTTEGELVYLTALHGGRAAGRTDVRFEPSTTTPRLLVRWPAHARADLHLDRLRVAPDPGRSAGLTGGPGLSALDVGQQIRAGVWLAPGGRQEFPCELGEGADTLRFAAALPPSGRGTPGSVTVTVAVDGETRTLASVGLGGQAGRWQEFALDLDGVPAGPVSFGLAVDGEIAVSAPEVSYERGARRPNVVLISLDTTRRDRLGLYGYGRGTTPNLDAFAEQAVVFEDAVAAAPYTLPSHATLFSGTYPAFHGAHHPAHALDLARTPMLADVLRDAGWATRAQTGGGYLSSDYGFGHGFTSYGNSDPLWDWEHPAAVARTPSAEARAAAARAHVPHTWATALDWMAERRDVPFFLFLQTFAVHDYRPPVALEQRFVTSAGQRVGPLRRFEEQKSRPYTPAEHRYLSDVYDAGLFWVDDHMGALLRRLDDLGLADETIVIVTADHGEELGERGFNGHGHTLQRELLAVPLLLRIPGVAPRRVAEPVSLVDVAPTLLDLLGVPQPAAMQGTSLRPLWEGTSARPSPVLSQVDSNVSRAASYQLGALKVVLGDPEAVVELPAERSLSIYDLSTDPGELHSLHVERAAAAAELARQLQALLQLEGDASARPAVELRDETLEQLRQLGYLDAGDAPEDG